MDFKVDTTKNEQKNNTSEYKEFELDERQKLRLQMSLCNYLLSF